MIIDKINQQIKDLNSISKHDSAVNDAAKQKSIDEKFKNLILDTKKVLRLLNIAVQNFNLM